MAEKEPLTVTALCALAGIFARDESQLASPELFGVTDGKAIGTWVERKLRAVLQDHYIFSEGNTAYGIDFPSLEVDMKVANITQPQSSCPFQAADQKIFGLGYSYNASFPRQDFWQDHGENARGRGLQGFGLVYKNPKCKRHASRL